MMKNHKYTFIFILLILSSKCFSQKTQDTLNILFVGNSYVYVANMPHLVSLISDSTKTKLLTSKSVSGGARLSHHWKGERGLRTKELIEEGDFDIVVLQDQSMSAIEHPDSLLLYVKKFSNYIRKNNAQPYLYSTWAREKVPQYQKVITDVYNQAARENNIGVVNVGETWEMAKKLRPNIELYRLDGSHQSPLGAFLTACAFVKEFSKELPVELANSYRVLDAHGESVELMYIDPLNIIFCLKVVKEITK